MQPRPDCAPSLGPWKRDDEARPTVSGTRDFDRAVVPLDDRSRDCEPESRASSIAGTGIVKPRESLEHGTPLVGWDPGPSSATMIALLPSDSPTSKANGSPCVPLCVVRQVADDPRRLPRSPSTRAAEAFELSTCTRDRSRSRRASTRTMSSRSTGVAGRAVFSASDRAASSQSSMSCCSSVASARTLE